MLNTSLLKIKGKILLKGPIKNSALIQMCTTTFVASPTSTTFTTNIFIGAKRVIRAAVSIAKWCTALPTAFATHTSVISAHFLTATCIHQFAWIVAAVHLEYFQCIEIETDN